MERMVSFVEEGQHKQPCLDGEDGKNLDELLEKNMPRLFRLADCILHNRYDSEDALQDGLLSAIVHIDQFKGNAQFSSWLYSIVRNSALTKLRRQKAHPSTSFDEQPAEGDFEILKMEVLGDSDPDPERACEQSELTERFARTLDCLPAHYRAIILLCDFEGFTGKEAAKRLGLTVSALKSQRNRARSAIRESMGAYFAR